MIQPVKIPIAHQQLRESLAYLQQWDIEPFHKEINKVVEKYKQSGNIGSNAWILVWRHRVLNLLEDHGIDVIDERGNASNKTWREIITDDRRDFESLFFEFEIAALLLSFGNEVSFVEESGVRPAPDLLVDGEMWAECKRKGVEPETETWLRERQNILNDVIEEGMELDDTFHSFVISFQGSKGPEEINELASELRDMIDDNLNIVDHRGHKIKRTGKSVQISDHRPEFDIGDEYFTPGAVDTRVVCYVNDSGEREGFTGAEVRFEFDDEWFYPEKIQRPLQKARSQNLSEKKKGAIFISIPQLYLPELVNRSTPEEDLAPDSDPKTQAERLNEVVTKRFLNTTDTVNAVCMIVPLHIKGLAHLPFIQYWENKDCKSAHPEFIDLLDRMRNTYHGYILANS